ncbi:hypothetical protein [Shewanella livingstonensis]|uniref:Uncharacterized protein n=1 Tax=Shewanella livingstonensis TaxID=150120 RepID=A0A3G8LW04_9GAMM|nr:hypothetical protein [Shewanella livingstonensis]AZG73836.1 hypothetical protein EGC82_14375 [Shewanella livingstonensis]
MKNINWSARNVVYAFMILALLTLLPILLQKGLANAYHFKSRFYIDQWQQGAKPNSLQYANALLAADYAFSIDGQNPHYLLTLAKVMEWGVFSKLAQANNTVFNQLYLDAITQRPNWPNAYSDYAYNLAFIQQDINQAWPYLEQALVYGPYTPEVLHQTLAIGFAYWPGLTMVQKQTVFSTAHIAASANWKMRNDLKQLASQYQLTQVMCTYFTYATPTNNNVDKWIKQDMCR